ncbi:MULTISPECIES: hypothetical protein [Candidatus Rhabdochlamydia]|uniref:hypothetical protein n=1 Tax=Candidatus Rhabdochlamydia TaxID=292833 RepID=UPI001BFC9431|nr:MULTISPECIES: hypothetical protein [Rhabdochlamydia]
MFMDLKTEENKPKNWFKRVKGLIHTQSSFPMRFQENKKTISMLNKQEKID